MTKDLGNKIAKILSINSESYTLKLKFTDGTSGFVDLGYIFSRPKELAAEIIKGQLFEKCYIESGAIAWPNGLELCPDSLRMRLNKSKKVAASKKNIMRLE